MRIIRLNEYNRVVSFRYGKSIKQGEIHSDVGELGQIMQEDGTFITPEPTPTEPQPTLEDKINYIYYKEMGLIL